MCVPQIQCNEAFCYVFNIFQALTIIVLGTVVPLILTILMFHKAKKLGTTVASGTIGNVEMVDPGVAEVRSRNIRAMVTIALLLASLVGLTLPLDTYMTARIMFNFDETKQVVSLIAVLFADLYLLIPVVDALVIWRNRDVKDCAMSLCKSLKDMIMSH